MILADVGILVDEETLRNCCNTDRLGTTAQDTVSCVERYGLKARSVTEYNLSQLQGWLNDDHYLIIYLNLYPLDAIWVTHAVVVEVMDEEYVTIMDPMQGRRDELLPAFAQAWQMARGQGILVIT